MNFNSSFTLNATLVSNEFIDTYMASANGEYIKEYLFLLRHDGEAVTASMIADAVNHTESDVARALSYWAKAGVLEEFADKAPEDRWSMDRRPAAGETACAGSEVAKKPEGANTGGDSPAQRPLCSPEQIKSLVGDEDFSQLLYIAQKYMNKVFTQRECEVFAYLYGSLLMTAELLEYAVEYCVQGGHTGIRYIETVAIDWHEAGLKTAEEAKAYAVEFTKDSFSVMRAFGLNDRRPGDMERRMINRWFKGYGFTRELVLEACNRTLEATHAPSFKYADKILSAWKEAGVRTPEDVKRLDERHAGQARGKNAAAGDYPAHAAARGRNSNQFQNFPQRDIDYDALVLQQITKN